LALRHGSQIALNAAESMGIFAFSMENLQELDKLRFPIQLVLFALNESREGLTNPAAPDEILKATVIFVVILTDLPSTSVGM
jgi:hypothetical protein